MYEYEEKSDIIGSPCSLMNPYKGYTEGTIVGDYGNTVVVRLTSGKEIVEFRDEVIIYIEAMTQIAMKFVQWDVPELEKLKGCRVYQLREQLDNGDKLSREDKNWITRNVKECIHFKRGIALMGYFFDFSDVLKRYFVKQHGHITEYCAIDKTALRSVLYGRIEDVVEV